MSALPLSVIPEGGGRGVLSVTTVMAAPPHGGGSGDSENVATSLALPVSPPWTPTITSGSVLDALEALHPALVGIVRDGVTGARRAMIRIYKAVRK
jgi:hypothetical protein